jgi:hypothetical protein
MVPQHPPEEVEEKTTLREQQGRGNDCEPGNSAGCHGVDRGACAIRHERAGAKRLPGTRTDRGKHRVMAAKRGCDGFGAEGIAANDAE